jgi:uncharacterized protein DUF3780
MAQAAAAFDCADIYREHAYLVTLTRGKDAKVQVDEVFGRAPEPAERTWAPETITRCQLPRTIWNAVVDEIKAEFNRRLKQAGKPMGRFGAEETAVQRLLGKEMLVLLWAIEQHDVSEEETAAAVRNWLGLKPEERWWLYTMTGAATGYAHQVGLGWRRALRDALCFGTRKDAFQLSTVPWPGSLPPRENAEYAAPKLEKSRSAEKAKSPKQSKERTELAALKRAKPRGADKPKKAKQSKKPKQPSLFLDAAE